MTTTSKPLQRNELQDIVLNPRFLGGYFGSWKRVGIVTGVSFVASFIATLFFDLSFTIPFLATGLAFFSVMFLKGRVKKSYLKELNQQDVFPRLHYLFKKNKESIDMSTWIETWFTSFEQDQKISNNNLMLALININNSSATIHNVKSKVRNQKTTKKMISQTKNMVRPALKQAS
jgi:uncharacterized membrane protein